jgi:hypothetical protein
LFIVTNNRQRVLDIVNDFEFPKGYEDIRIQPVITTPVELLESEETEQAFLKSSAE